MRWALIGASRIASSYVIDAIRAQDGSEIRSVLSANAERGEQFARNNAIPDCDTDLERILGDERINAVYISTTNEKHHAQALAAIAAGKHVLCEKPLAMTLSDAASMVRAAEEAGVIFATNHHLRNAGSHLAIRTIVSSGRIGSVLSARVHHAVNLPEHLRGWRINSPAAGGGVIPDITVHDADTIRFHLDEDPVEVVAKSGVSGMGQGVEDSVMSIWSMPSGAMVQSHESFTHRFAGTGIQIHGTDGSIFATNVMTQEPVGEIRLVTSEGEKAVPFENHNLYHRSLGLFTKAVGGVGRPAADGVDGVKSLAVALAVRDAAQAAKAVRVDYDGF
ncbi:MAG: Gfo/Idh/MocA family oxidoreductase [Stappiaceae bacterium]